MHTYEESTETHSKEQMESDMEDETLSKKTKRSRACHTCKKRKGKCEGGVPCRWCVARNLKCSTMADPTLLPKKKRKDDGSRTTVVLNSRELGLLSDVEVGLYIDMYLRSCMIDIQNGGSVIKNLKNPKSYSAYLIKYATCALAARACGDAARANNIMNEARSFARQSYDDMSTESLAGFVLLSLFWLGVDVNVMKHYGAIGANIFDNIPHDQLPTHLGYITVAQKHVISSTASYDEKMKMFAENLQDIGIASPAAAFLGGQVRLTMKLLAQTPTMKLSSCRDVQREAAIQEINEYRAIGGHFVNPLPIFVNNFLEVFVTWRSGNINQAIDLAVELSHSCNTETFQFASPVEIEFLLALAILVYESHPPVAAKYYTLAENIHSIVCVPSPLAQSAEHLSAFLLEVLPPDPIPRTSRKNRSPQSQSASRARAVDGLLSLANCFVPNGNMKGLVSLEGLRTLFTSLNHLCPPFLSLFDPLVHLPSHHYLPKLAFTPTLQSDQITVPSPAASPSPIATPSAPNPTPNPTPTTTPTITPTSTPTPTPPASPAPVLAREIQSTISQIQFSMQPFDPSFFQPVTFCPTPFTPMFSNPNVVVPQFDPQANYYSTLPTNSPINMQPVMFNQMNYQYLPVSQQPQEMYITTPFNPSPFDTSPFDTSPFDTSPFNTSPCSSPATTSSPRSPYSPTYDSSSTPPITPPSNLICGFPTVPNTLNNPTDFQFVNNGEVNNGVATNDANFDQLISPYQNMSLTTMDPNLPSNWQDIFNFGQYNINL